jgi:hypothetical protein
MFWSNKVGHGKTTKCFMEKRNVSNIYRRNGAPPMRGAASPSPFSPLHGDGNPLLHGKVTPLIK